MQMRKVVFEIPEDLYQVMLLWPSVEWTGVLGCAIHDANWRMTMGLNGLVPQVAPPKPAAPPEVKP